LVGFGKLVGKGRILQGMEGQTSVQDRIDLGVLVDGRANHFSIEGSGYNKKDVGGGKGKVQQKDGSN